MKQHQKDVKQGGETGQLGLNVETDDLVQVFQITNDVTKDKVVSTNMRSF